MKELHLAECLAIDTELQSLDADAIKSQNIGYLMEMGLKISGWISFTGQEMAYAKKLWNDAKKRAYQSVQLSLRANGDNLAPSLLKDYVNTKCGAEEFSYDQIERVHRSCERTLDFMRTIISGLKAEIYSSQQTANY